MSGAFTWLGIALALGLLYTAIVFAVAWNMGHAAGRVDGERLARRKQAQANAAALHQEAANR